MNDNERINVVAATIYSLYGQIDMYEQFDMPTLELERQLNELLAESNNLNILIYWDDDDMWLGE